MIALISFLGCALFLSEDNFPDQYAAALCSRYQECLKGAFEAEYDDDMDECIDDGADLFDDIDNDCDFDPDEGADCLDSIRSISCGDMVEDGIGDDCDKVYDCD